MSNNKLDCMRYAGRINRQAIEAGFQIAKPGITLARVNDAVEAWIIKAGCRPAFKGYQPGWSNSPFPAAACISPNDVAVHGIPGNYVIQLGDLITIDVGTEYEGWYADSAMTSIIGGSYQTSEKCAVLLYASRAILDAQLSVIRDGCTLLEIARASENEAKRRGVTLLPQFSGHFIGDRVHIEPGIPSCIDRTQYIANQLAEIKRLSQYRLKEGDTICLEPVVTYGSTAIMVDDDQWTVRKADGQLVSHLEHCLLVLENGYEIL